MRAKVPVRVNLLGGWSDQPQWPFSAAVVNAAVGWQKSPGDDPYPIRIDEEGIHSKIEGIGTGLGASSIIMAAKYLIEKGGKAVLREYVDYVLTWEREEGTQGGWQDQIGGIEPGFKLIETEDHVHFRITTRDSHPVWNHLVLFDTKIRRPSRIVGDKVRALFRNPKFQRALKENVKEAREYFYCDDPQEFALACLRGWQRLVKFVPQMEIPLPAIRGVWGSMLVGAGAGGWGIFFVKNPEDRTRVIAELQSYGLPAYLPVLLGGIEFF